jgi:hypothetical protein
MKKSVITLAALLMLFVAACKKSADDASSISLSASATETATGQSVAVTVSSNLNASRWAVSPTTATAAYTVTTRKVNYFTFNQPGVYTISVTAKSVSYDSAGHQSLDSCWNHAAGRRGGCVKGVDSASVQITVLK